MKYIAITIILLLGITAYSQTIVKGKVYNAPGKTIKLSVYEDQITNKKKVIGQTVISKDGSFSIQLDLKKTYYTFFSIEFQRAEIYLEPNATYDLIIHFNPESNTFSYLNNNYLKHEFKDLSKESLNYQIQEFNSIFNQFVIDHFDDIYKRRKRSLLDTLKNEVSNAIGEVRHPFLNDYITYRLAALEQPARLKGYTAIVTDYFNSKPILYDNIEYMEFFNQLFTAYLFLPDRNFLIMDIEQVVNGDNSLDSLRALVDKDPILTNEQLKELVLIKGLKDLYYIEGFSRENVAGFLNEIKTESPYPEHQIIAGNILGVAKRFAKGSPAPEFRLKDFQGKSHALSDYKDKYVFINFITMECRECLREMDSIKAIYPMYKDNVEFITISNENDASNMATYLQGKAYPWTILDYGKDADFMEKYNVIALPLYIMIDKKGNFYKYPALIPGDSFRRPFKGIQ